MTMKSFTDMGLPDMTDAYRQVQEKNLDPVNPVAVKKKFKDRKDKDVDNDGDVDSSDKYLHKKRKAISKAIKNEHHQKDENGKVIEHDGQEVEEAYTVTNADKKGNTPAYQNFKKGMKGKDGKPLYKAADHMKEEEIHPSDNVLSPEELERVAELSREWDAKMEEGYGGSMKGYSKGGEVKKASANKAKKFLDDKAKKLQKEYDNQSAGVKNNPAFQASKLNPQPRY